MSIADLKYRQFLQYVREHGQARDTRSGTVFSCFSPPELRFENVGEFFPLLTLKKMRYKSVIGELLWFLNGSTNLPTLRRFSNLDSEANTIWSADAERFWTYQEQRDNVVESWQRHGEYLGRIYGAQWRYWTNPWIDPDSDTEETYDQIQHLIEGLRTNPNGRYHIVTAFNPAESLNPDVAALPPCHMFFQCYVEGRKLHLKWYQRSVDSILGLPYNIASYAALLQILAQFTGHEVGDIIGTFGDAHIYEAHLEALEETLARDATTYSSPRLVLPVGFDDLACIDEVTANDFDLIDYESHPLIHAPLMVG